MTEPGRDDRPNPDQLLEQVRRQAGAGARGRHRIYLGMAPGVGKTFAALQELQRRAERSTDAIVGYVETHGRPKTAEALEGLEVAPRRKVEYRGVTIEEMDVDAIIKRGPSVCVVDELAHTNAPGSKHEKRWQDVEDLLAAGITVISTVNIQHLESLADIVETITGVTVHERIPDGVVDGADELELVDMSPHALRQRMRHGNIYPPDRAEQALRRFFREGNLTALRELALRKVATTVEQDLEEYLHAHHVEGVWPAAERVLVCVDASAEAQHLVRRAWALANRAQAPLTAVFVETPAWSQASPEVRRTLEENLRFAEDMGAECVRLRANDVAAAVANLAQERNAGSIVLAHHPRSWLSERLREPVASRLLRLAPALDVHVIIERPRPS